jgi:hypothetical protein
MPRGASWFPPCAVTSGATWTPPVISPSPTSVAAFSAARNLFACRDWSGRHLTRRERVVKRGSPFKMAESGPGPARAWRCSRAAIHSLTNARPPGSMTAAARQEATFHLDHIVATPPVTGRPRGTRRCSSFGLQTEDQ